MDASNDNGLMTYLCLVMKFELERVISEQWHNSMNGGAIYVDTYGTDEESKLKAASMVKVGNYRLRYNHSYVYSNPLPSTGTSGGPFSISQDRKRLDVFAIYTYDD